MVPAVLSTIDLFLFLFLFHVLDVLVDQDWPRREAFVICAQIFAFVAKIQEAGPLVEGDP